MSAKFQNFIGVEQALTHLEVKKMFDDSTYYVDDDATEADKLMMLCKR